MRVGTIRALTAGVLVVGLCRFQAETAFGQGTFRHVIIDPTPPREPHCKAIGDIDGDGFIDVLTASSTNFTEGLFWYRYPTWEKLSIHEGSFTTDMQVGDVDGDGDLDAIIPKGKYKGASVWWYENPRPTGDPAARWTEHFVGNAPSHDIEVADMDGDGKLDVIVRDGPSTIFFQDTPDQWTGVLISDRPGEGTSVGDVDLDGDIDIAINSYWLENPGPTQSPRTAPWTPRLVDTNWPELVSTWIVDINNDSRPDILLSPSETGHGRFSWYEAVDPREGPWTEHVIDADVSYSHTFKTADMDKDGTLDIVTAEMHQADYPRRVSIYFNDNGDATSWTKQILSDRGSHNIRIGDIGSDGDIDIVGANWGATETAGPPLEMWENLSTSSPTTLPLDRWQRHVIDDARPWRAMFVTSGDLDGDQMPDVVTGAWWYKNPGFGSGDWVRQELGSPLNNMAAVYDFDNNGTLDVLGTQGVDASSNSQMAWAKNDGSGHLTVMTNIQPADGTFLQGSAVARFAPGGPLEVALSWHETSQGSQMLTVPADPSTETWSWRSISPTSQHEQLTAADIDRDGDTDLLMGTSWLRNDGSAWTPLTLNGITVDVDRSRLADINGDGRLDALVGFETTVLPGRLAWYEQPAQADQQWTEHVITTEIIGAMSLDVADMDADGDLDVVTGEHNLANPAAARLWVFENADGQGGNWIPRLVHTGDEHHSGAQTVDIEGDGDLDIISIGWGHGNVILYENLAIGGGSGGTPPTITVEPRNAGAPYGWTAAFTVQVKGDEPLSYQWRRDGVDIPGATGSTYTTDPLTFEDNGARFDCVVRNQAGITTSREVFLLVASSAHRTASGLQAAYTFEEGTGRVVKDISGVGQPLDLQIPDPNAVEWTINGLLVLEPTLISSAVPATKITQASQLTQEITVEAWIKASIPNQVGPARIVTLSKDHDTRNFTLGQGDIQGVPSVIDVRQRTTETSMNGTPSVTTPEGTFKAEVTHVVYTRRANGVVQTYINGWPAVDKNIAGDLSNWDSSFHLGLANEFTNDRPWLGEYRLVTFYDRALTPQEVVNNYAANPWPAITDIETEPENKDIPGLYALHQNSPNPFNPSTVIRYELPVGTRVQLTVFDLLGREIATLVNEEQPRGIHAVRFEAGDLASGVYLYRLTAGNFSATKKLLLVR